MSEEGRKEGRKEEKERGKEKEGREGGKGTTDMTCLFVFLAYIFSIATYQSHAAFNHKYLREMLRYLL